jgi:hypothetical protein
LVLDMLDDQWRSPVGDGRPAAAETEARAPLPLLAVCRLNHSFLKLLKLAAVCGLHARGYSLIRNLFLFGTL